MKTVVYYFSGTGNSLSVAKKVRDMLGDVELISIPKAFHSTKLIRAKKVGFVFPIYAWGMPRMVKEFIENTSFEGVEYCFAVSNSGGSVGSTHEVLKSMLKRKSVLLNAGIALREPSNAIDINTDSPMHKFIRSTRGNRPHLTIEQRYDEVRDILRNNKSMPVEKDAFIMRAVSSQLYKVAINMFKKQDTNYWVTDRCNGCGTCERVCPGNNIAMENAKPVFKHNCEYCTACINWCPTQALQSGESTEGQKRYHKEGIKLEELM